MRASSRLLITVGIALATYGSSVSPAFAGLLNSPCATGSFYTSDDDTFHTIVADDAGNVWEVYWQDPNFPGVALLGSFAGADGSHVKGVAGYYTPFDNYRHALVEVQPNLSDVYTWQFYEIYYQPAYGVSQDMLFEIYNDGYHNVPGAITGYMSTDNFEHLVYADFQGNNQYVYDYEFGPYVIDGRGFPDPHRITLQTLPFDTSREIYDLAGYTAHDGWNHVIVDLYYTGELWEDYYTRYVSGYSDQLTPGFGSFIQSIGAADSWGYDPYHANTVFFTPSDYYNLEYFNYGTSGNYLSNSHHLNGIVLSMRAMAQYSNYSRVSTVATSDGNLFVCTASGNDQSCPQVAVSF